MKRPVTSVAVGFGLAPAVSAQPAKMGPEVSLILLHAREQADADRVVTEDPASKNGVFVGAPRRFIPRFVGKAPLTLVNP